MLIRVVLIILLVFEYRSSLANECTNIKANESPHDNKPVVIQKPGRYCLQSDVKLQDNFVISEGGWKSNGRSGLFIIETYDPSEPHEGRGLFDINPIYVKPGDGPVFDIDLQKHTLSHKSKTGVGFIGRAYRTRIQNGSIKDVHLGIKLYGGFSGVWTVGRDDNRDLSSEEFEDMPFSKLKVKNNPPKYQNTDYLIDSINVFSIKRGAEVSGSGNVIRNSIIEVDGHTAIYMYGPNPIIENNTIVIYGKGEGEFYLKGRGYERIPNGKNPNGSIRYDSIWHEGKKTNIQSAPIKLRDAQGGIIRNNRIIYKGGLFSGKAPVAINLLDSKDVLIEGNTIEGFENLVRENGDTSYIENNNTLN
ncbi:MAG: right-handed parallel beta-helix repeat-containing protein [Methylophilus sp.]|nr:right-handed parallel beta-helix repeat-containing protein [Methylophilus sp.]